MLNLLKRKNRIEKNACADCNSNFYITLHQRLAVKS